MKYVIQVEMCRGCGRALFVRMVANLTLRCETDALTVQGAVDALLAGRELWKVSRGGELVPAGPDALQAGRRETLVASHRCTAVSGPPTQPRRESPHPPLPSPPVAPSRPFSGPSTGSSSVPVAVTPRSEGCNGYVNRICDTCRGMIGRAPMVGVQVGSRWVWAMHDECPPQLATPTVRKEAAE